jgi:hypothetical protein
MSITSHKKVENMTTTRGSSLSYPSLFVTVPTTAFEELKNTPYNKGILTVHLSSPLIVLTNVYI